MPHPDSLQDQPACDRSRAGGPGRPRACRSRLRRTGRVPVVRPCGYVLRRALGHRSAPPDAPAQRAPGLPHTRRRPRARPRARGGLPGLLRVGRVHRPPPLPPPGRGPVRDPPGSARHRRHPHRLGQVHDRARGPHGEPCPRQPLLLHRAAQGPGEREVLRTGAPVRSGQRRHGHRGHLHQRRRPHHLLHGGDPGQPVAARGRGAGRGQRRHGRVPLLRGPAARLGLAGAAPRAATGADGAHVRDPGRRVLPRRRHAGAHGPRGRRRRRCRAARPLGDGVRRRAHQRPPPAPRAAGQGTGVRRPLLPEGGDREGRLTAERGPGRQGAQGGAGRGAGRLPLRRGLRSNPVAAAATRDRRPSCRHAAALPAAGGEAGATGPAVSHLRH